MSSPKSKDHNDPETPSPSTIARKEWYRTSDGGDGFMCTTNRSHIDEAALSAALESEMIWWAKPLSPTQLRTFIDNSLCFTLLRNGPELQESAAAQGKPPLPPFPSASSQQPAHIIGSFFF